MGITISGENNNDRILASDGVIDQLSGFNVVGVLTATSFTGDLTGNVTGNLTGNVTGNVNATSNLLLQIGGSEKFRVASSGQLGIGGANYGTSGQVLTSGGSGSAATWSTITGTTINNNADDRVITGSGTANTLNGEQRLTFNSSNILTATETGTGNGMGGIRAATANAGGNAGYGFVTNNANRFAVTTIGSAGAESLRIYDDNSNAERLRIDSGGRIGLGIANPGDYFSSYNRVVMGRPTDAGSMTIVSAPTYGGYIAFADGTSGNQAYRGLIAYYHGQDAMTFGTDGGVERLRITSGGQLIVGHNASHFIDQSAHHFRLQVSGTNYATSGISQQRFENAVSGATLTLAHSRNGTQGNHTILQSNDEYGKIRFYGSDGTDFEGFGAAIVAKVESGINANSTPGRLEFHTTSSGSTDGTERLRIDSAGHIGINRSSPTRTLHISSDDDLTSFTGTGYGTVAVENSQYDSGDYNAIDFTYSGSNNPIARIATKITGGGSSLHFGTSNNYSSGITNEAFTIDSSGNLTLPTTDAKIMLKDGNNYIQFVNADKTFKFNNAWGAGEFSFNVNGGERLRINGSGNVGINNSSPAYLLDVTGASVVARFKSSNNNNVLALQGNNASHLAYMGTNSSGDFLVATGGSVTTRLNINTSGRVRLSGVPGVAGSNLTNISIESDGNLCTQTSLREYKTNITSISDISWLYNFNPVTFNWKKKTEVNGENVWEDTADDNGTQYGLIAEEVEAVKKEFCYYDNDNKLSGVHYDRLIAPLLKAIQEQKAEIDALKTRVVTLEGS